MVQRPNEIAKNIKVLEEDLGVNLYTLALDNGFQIKKQSHMAKEKNR